MTGSDRSQADALDRVWEALSGRPTEPVRPGELDPRDEALPARLIELERVAMRQTDPAPHWAAVRERIQAPTTLGSAPARRIWPFGARDRPLVGSTWGRGWWPALELAMGATAILVLLGIVYGWNLKQVRFWDAPSPTHPAFGGAPAAVGSIEETPTPPSADPTATANPTPALSATTVPPSAMRPVFPRGMTIDQLSTAVAVAIPQFAWPPNYQASHALITAGWQWSTNSSYAAGGEWTIVGMYHTCAWGRTWLDARESGDQVLKARALQELTDVVPYNPNYGGDTGALWADAARRAANDDPSALITLMASMSCDEKAFLGPAGAVTPPSSPTPEAGDGSPASPVELSAPGISWSPIELTVAQGWVIRLINDGTGGPHNFVIEGYYNDDTPIDMPPGGQTDWTVPSDLPPGTYTFYCSIPGHRALMEGTITILPADTGGGLSAPTPAATLP